MIGMGLAFILLLFQGATAVRPGVAAGRLLNVDGTPARAIRVVVVPAPEENVKVADGTNYYSVQQPPASNALTDNDGRYRLTNIPPGRYFLVADVTYYPSTLDPDKSTILRIAAGSTTENLDFRLLKPLGGKVSGRISPKPLANAREKAMLSGPNMDGVLEAPITPDGAFEFGHVPTGPYWIDISPTPPGMGGHRMVVGDRDVAGVELTRPVTHVVTGKIVMQNGPIPQAILNFSTTKSYVGGVINPDGTFTVPLHSAHHKLDLSGMPGWYSIASVRVGAREVSEIVVENADVSNVVISVAAPKNLPHMRGKVTGLPAARLASTKVEMTGPIIGTVETPVRPDGSFEFTALTPGLYRLRLSQVTELAPMNVVVTWNDTDVQVAVPSR